ncbi:MAG: FAD-binding oxidoreductase [Rhodocyclales bacterium GT-UBC]|nr:MAG: FAD-binding oxidoreductase [Rhodocyclales bacterium GT-UBC]
MKKILVIGGGFFGLYLAEFFSTQGHNVRLVERESSFMSRASFNNQARVHNGYHYPRSILTALRSRISFPRFIEEFDECISSDFEKYYLIGKPLGKISARQFLKFCERIGAICDPAPDRLRKLVNPNFIEACFSVTEFAFDAIKLRDKMIARLGKTSADLCLGVSAQSIRGHQSGLIVTLRNETTGGQEESYFDHAFNCTYSKINEINAQSSLNLVNLKHEMTEVCLVDVPDELKNTGITVMCGPFFSVMPFPSTALHSFSHVRYTPHYEWHDRPGEQFDDAEKIGISERRHSAWLYMQKDATRYLPLLAECRYERSLWETKTVLPRSETDDSRPILFLENHGLPGFHCIMGGKIDNVYDVIQAIADRNLIPLTGRTRH